MRATRDLRRRLWCAELCLPRLALRPPAGPGWIHEIEHDGFRILAKQNAAAVHLFTRKGYDLAVRFPLATTAVAALPARSCLIDGEAIARDQNGLAVFEMIRWRRHDQDVVLCAFDLLELDGQDLRKVPIEERKQTLAKLLHRSPAGITFNEYYDGDGTTLFRHACRFGCEGIVSKRLGSPYRSGRVDDWLKIKNPLAPAAKREADRGR
jgi:bifunctional non-homologous end joining protein LigD